MTPCRHAGRFPMVAVYILDGDFARCNRYNDVVYIELNKGHCCVGVLFDWMEIRVKENPP